ncbi:MAG: hypothetical protein ACREJ3_13635, partial [Polyangiaceae bacterium]
VVLVGSDPSRLAARDGAVVALGEAETGAQALWGEDADRPGTGSSWRMRVARGLGALLVKNAMVESQALAAQIDGDGGSGDVIAAVAMLALDAPRAVRAAQAGLIAAKNVTKGHVAAMLADALGALCAFAPSPAPSGGLSIPVGSSRAESSIELTGISLDPAGTAASFRLKGHRYRIERDSSGAVTDLRRDAGGSL